MPSDNTNTASFNLKLIQALLLIARHQGVSLDKALEHSVIKQHTLDTPGQRYPTASFEELLTHLTLISQNPNFVLLAAEITQPRMLGSLGFVMTTANTLLDAYQMLGDYFSLIYDGIKLSIIHEQENCTINIDVDSNNVLVTEFFIGCLLNWPRWLIGRTIPAQSIHYSFNQNSTKNYQQLANKVLFDQPSNQITFQNQYMNLQCSEANSEMHQLHCNFADSLLVKSSQKQALIAQTKHQIRKVISETDSSHSVAIRREHIAHSLNMSLRTFQRKLNALHSSFQLIYDSVRQETCLQMMNQGDANLSQIAYKLGFSNLSSFQKAFKRWMKISPSAYRKQICAIEHQSKAISINPPRATIWHLNLSEQELKLQISKKIKDIGNFSQNLLLISALAQQSSNKATSIKQLADITGNSIARLNIYLWPSTQQNLIENIDNLDSFQAALNFTPIKIIDVLIDFASAQQIAHNHYIIATFYMGCAKHSAALQHFLLCNPELLKADEQLLIINFCNHQLHHSSQINNNTLNDIYNLLIRCKYAHQQDYRKLIPIYIDQIAIWIELNLFAQAQQKIEELHSQPLNFDQRISLAMTASQLLVELNQIEEALVLLTDTAAKYCGIIDATNLKSNVLIDISHQLETVADQYSNRSENFKQPIIKLNLTSTITNQLRLLQKIITVCLQANLSLRAAGAIARMFSLSLNHCDDYYSSFACAHFSWLCSWFAADIKMASDCSKRSLYLAAKHSEAHLQNCKLIFAAKLNHWLEPLDTSIQELRLEAAFFNHLTDKNSLERQAVLQQLLLCKGESLKSIQENCKQLLLQQTVTSENPSTSALNNILKAATHLLAPTALKRKAATYTDCISAFTQLFSAFYAFEYPDWETMQNWDSRIEADLSSHYIATEAVFMCTLMRIHCLKSQPENDLNKTRLAGNISRLKMWNTLRPENYSAQYTIAKAVYFSHFNNEAASITYFESAFSAVNQHGSTQHQMLYYHYYEQLLNTHSPALSALCKEKKQQKLAHWHS